MSKKREVRVRKCVATNMRHQKEELLRVVCVDGVAVIDSTGIREGRGAYIMPDEDLIQQAKKKNAFSRALRMNVDEKIYDALLEMVRQ
jgi:predicted RNA-binding protein YlxR (DUF448 family)